MSRVLHTRLCHAFLVKFNKQLNGCKSYENKPLLLKNVCFYGQCMSPFYPSNYRFVSMKYCSRLDIGCVSVYKLRALLLWGHDVKQESLANAKVNAQQHCVVRSHWNAGNAIWRTTMFHVVASQTREITRNTERIRPYSSSRSSKVIDLGVNGKPTCDLLLVINSNFSPIWYRFRDIDA